ncbi:MAG: 3-oxoacyl-ACP synthase III family protein [Patescibacteria group bacterium]
MPSFGMRINAIAAYLPPYLVSNALTAARLRLERGRVNRQRKSAGLASLTSDEAKEFTTNDRWIQRFIGFHNRRFILDGEGTIDLAARAGQLLFSQLKIDPDAIDAICFGRVTPSYLYSPPDAALLQEALGIPSQRDGMPRELYGLDGSLACSTWPAMLQAVYARIRSGMSKNVLLVGADAMSTTINWRDRAFATVLGDAGTVAWCSAVPEEEDWFSPTQFWSWMDGAYAHVIETPCGGSRRPLRTADELIQYQNRLAMNGRVVKDLFVPFMSGPGIDAILTKAGWSLEDIDFATMHEANRAQINGPIVASWKKRGFRGEVLDADGQIGNTTSASIPAAVTMHPQQMVPGKRFIWVGFGGGASASSALGTVRHPIELICNI